MRIQEFLDRLEQIGLSVKIKADSRHGRVHVSARRNNVSLQIRCDRLPFDSFGQAMPLQTHVAPALATRWCAYERWLQPNGGWIKTKFFYSDVTDVTPEQFEALRLRSLKEKLVITRQQIGEQTFANSIVGEPIFVRRRTIVRRCKVNAIVRINKGICSDAAIAEPNARTWFLMDCESHGLASYFVAYDPQTHHWLPVNKSGRISTTMRPKSSVDLQDLSKMDEQLFEHAIKLYLSKIQG